MKLIQFAVLGLVLILQGCGFHARGALQEAAQMPVTYLQPPDRPSDLQAQLSGVNRIVDDPKKAQAILILLGDGFLRNTASVGSSSGKVREYELEYNANFTVNDKAGKVLLPPQTITLSRTYLYDETRVLGIDNEETILRRDMIIDAAGQIVRRLQAIELPK